MWRTGVSEAVFYRPPAAVPACQLAVILSEGYGLEAGQLTQLPIGQGTINFRAASGDHGASSTVLGSTSVGGSAKASGRDPVRTARSGEDSLGVILPIAPLRMNCHVLA
jgi:hypothetical protein